MGFDFGMLRETVTYPGTLLNEDFTNRLQRTMVG